MKKKIQFKQHGRSPHNYLIPPKRKRKKYDPKKNYSKIVRIRYDIEKAIFRRKSVLVFNEFKDFINIGSGDLNVDIPREFCLCSNYEESLKTIKLFASSIFDLPGSEIVLDFSRCDQADTAALSLMQIIKKEMLIKLRGLQKRFEYFKTEPTISFVSPSSYDVLRNLLTTGYDVDASNITEDTLPDLHPIDTIGYYKGNSNQNHYLENKKTVYSNRVVQYLNNGLKRHGYQFTFDNKSNLESITGEVLSNAEDHSSAANWFITANFSREISDNNGSNVSEINLTILNFGYSFFEAFEKTKEDNNEIYVKLEQCVSDLNQKYPNIGFQKEQLFTWLMMSDQVSRLRYKERSRGTGTMKFINSYFELGDYEDSKKGYIPSLSVITGHTHLICDNKFKPVRKESVYLLPLNKEESLNYAPSSTNLKCLKNKFPGTMLSVKIYLNKNHLDKKYGNGHE